MKKICFCTTVSMTMKLFVVDTAKYLYEKCGYDITLICSGDKEFEKSLPPYIKFIPIDMVRGIDFSAPKVIKKLISVFKQNSFDMVQYSTPNAAFCAAVAAKIAKVPVRLYCQWGIRYVGLSGFARFLLKRIEKIVCRFSTDIRAVSFMNRDFAVKEHLFKADKVKVLGKGGTIGVDFNEFDISKAPQFREEIRKEYYIDKEDFVFGFSGRLTRDKGTIELLTAFERIAKKRENVKLLIVGPADNDKEEIKNLVNRVKETGKVIFAGRVDYSSIKKFYSAMDVLVHPTYREGFGMVIQEAGALGIPTITTRIPGASEVMEEGKSCFLVEPKNSDELEKMMEYALSNKEEVIRIGQAARERTEKYFNRPVMLETLKNDYQNLLGMTNSND